MPGPSVGNGPDRRVDAVVTLVLAAGCIALLEVGPGAEVAVSEALRGTALRPFLEAQDWVNRRAELQDRVSTLVQENARLQSELVRRRGLERENRELRELVAISGEEGRFLPSEVFRGEPRLGVARRFLLPAGRGSGIRAPAGVLTADGVVGVVRTVTADGAAGDFWTHPDYRASVRVRGGGVTGIVRPDDAESAQPALVFEGAPYQDEIPEGTVLVTTGAGGVYPPGVPVGTVQGLAEVERGWARSYRVRPAVRPEDVSAALVWLPAPVAPGDSTAARMSSPWPDTAEVDTAGAEVDTAAVPPEGSGPAPDTAAADPAATADEGPGGRPADPIRGEG